MNHVLLAAAAALDRAAPAGGASLGKWSFVGALAVLVLWLVLMPRRLLGQEQHVPPWWRNVRVWAIVVALAQLGVYLYWG